MRLRKRATNGGAEQLHVAGEDDQVGAARLDPVGHRRVARRRGRRSRRGGRPRSRSRPPGPLQRPRPGLSEPTPTTSIPSRPCSRSRIACRLVPVPGGEDDERNPSLTWASSRSTVAAHDSRARISGRACSTCTCWRWPSSSAVEIVFGARRGAGACAGITPTRRERMRAIARRFGYGSLDGAGPSSVISGWAMASPLRPLRAARPCSGKLGAGRRGHRPHDTLRPAQPKLHACKPRSSAYACDRLAWPRTGRWLT